MTTAQQHTYTERIISAIKLKNIKTISEDCGRKLKSIQFPGLSTLLSYAFGEFDGGTEAHPRLTTGTMPCIGQQTMPQQRNKQEKSHCL